MWYLLVFLLCVQKGTTQFRYEETTEVSYQLAGLFDKDSDIQEAAFKQSLHDVNLKEIKINPVIIKSFRSDSYSVWRELCSHKGMQPIAIFGPQNPISDGSIRDQCVKANIPHIQAAWQPMDPDLELNEEEEDTMDGEENIINAEEETIDAEEGTMIEDDEGEVADKEDTGEDTETEESETETKEEEEISFKPISINFIPNSEELALAYGKLLKYYKWENFAVLYEDNFGLLRVQKILAEVTAKSRVSLFKLDPYGDNRKIFKELVKNQESRFLIDCHVDRVLNYMKEADELKIVKDYQHYIIVSMNTYIVAEKLLKLPSNTTWLSLIDYDNIKDGKHYLAPRVGKWNNATSSAVTDFKMAVGLICQGMLRRQQTNYKSVESKPMHSNSVQKLTSEYYVQGSITRKMEALLMDDIANHMVKALKDIKDFDIPPEFDCSSEEAWPLGAILQNKILETTSVGVTGTISFNEQGQRINYILYVNEIHTQKRLTVGRWESNNGSEIIDTRPNLSEIGTAQTAKEFIVISRRARPYFYEKEKCVGDDCEEESDDPNDKWEGFSVDLVKNIFQILREEKFNYTYRFVHKKDQSYGKMNADTKKWDGLIGELLDKTADLAVCDLTITEERKKVVDFSVPFMTLGISILYTTEHKVLPGTFSFLNPYSVDVWMYTATAYCIVSLILFVCARISPADWENPEPCEKDPEELENIWTLKNCAWLTLGSIMTQGCDILPKAFGTRWVCGMWWFFAVIVCQTYIAQLSASMTSALENEPINSVDDLARQNKILYGAIYGGSTFEFFKSSKDKMYHGMYENMIANPVVFVKSNEEGEKRVLKSKNKYAFFMESCTIEYKLKRNCELQKVGGELDSKDYGIAMPANSPYRTHINRAILRLKERTILDKIKNNWWEHKYGATDCDDKKDENDLEGDLEMDNLIGAFIVLLAGLGCSLIITAVEFMNEVRNIVVREQVTHKEVFIKELKASLNFFKLQKPVLRNPSRAPSIAASDSEDRRQQKRTMNAIDSFLDLDKES